MLLVSVRPCVHISSKAQDTTDEGAAVALPQTRARFTTACADLSMMLLTRRYTAVGTGRSVDVTVQPHQRFVPWSICSATMFAKCILVQGNTFETRAGDKLIVSVSGIWA